MLETLVRRCFGAVATNVYQRIKVEEKREEASLIISMGKLIDKTITKGANISLTCIILFS